MISLESWDLVQEKAAREPWALFYLSLLDCGVCTALKPKVEALAGEYGLPVYFVDLNAVPEAGGQWSVFTIPGVIFTFQGKEIWRGARFISLQDLEASLDRYSAFLR